MTIINDFLLILLLPQEIYYLWELAGGDVVAELGRHGLMVTMPPVVALPKIVLGEGHFQGQVYQLFSNSIFSESFLISS